MTPTIVQRRATDVRLFGAAGYALCLQVAHPTIAAGVRDHSTYATDPWGRFVGTADFVNLVVYGRPEQVAAASTGLRAMHKRIRGTDPAGTRYSALEPGAYAWVHATLAEAIVKGHAIFGTRLTPDEKQAFWTEWIRLGTLMGVGRGDLPETWGGFQAYLRCMVDEVLVHNDVIDAVQAKAADATGGSPVPWIPPWMWGYAGRPLGRFGAFLARGTLGAELRDKFHVPWSARHEAQFRSIAAASRAAAPLMAPPLRHAGPLALQLRKHAIAKGPFA